MKAFVVEGLKASAIKTGQKRSILSDISSGCGLDTLIAASEEAAQRDHGGFCRKATEY